jgi:hypothetical protein
MTEKGLTRYTTGRLRSSDPDEEQGTQHGKCSNHYNDQHLNDFHHSSREVAYAARSEGILTSMRLLFLRSLSVQNSPLWKPSCQILNQPPPVTSPEPLSPIFFMYTAHGPWWETSSGPSFDPSGQIRHWTVMVEPATTSQQLFP